jgi:hypothetical protein
MSVKITAPPNAQVPLLRVEDKDGRLTIRCMAEGSLQIETQNLRSRSAAQVVLNLTRGEVTQFMTWMNMYLGAR